MQAEGAAIQLASVASRLNLQASHSNTFWKPCTTRCTTNDGTPYGRTLYDARGTTCEKTTCTRTQTQFSKVGSCTTNDGRLNNEVSIALMSHTFSTCACVYWLLTPAATASCPGHEVPKSMSPHLRYGNIFVRGRW